MSQRRGILRYEAYFGSLGSCKAKKMSDATISATSVLPRHVVVVLYNEKFTL
jgi:hypothetical protein